MFFSSAARPPQPAAHPCSPQGLLDADSTLGPAFSRARFLVLDEADRLLEPSFEAELEAVLRLLPEQRQTLLFSATMTKALVALQKVGRGWSVVWGPGLGCGWVGLREGGLGVGACTSKDYRGQSGAGLPSQERESKSGGERSAL